MTSSSSLNAGGERAAVAQPVGEDRDPAAARRERAVHQLEEARREQLLAVLGVLEPPVLRRLGEIDEDVAHLPSLERARGRKAVAAAEM